MKPVPAIVLLVVPALGATSAGATATADITPTASTAARFARTTPFNVGTAGQLSAYRKMHPGPVAEFTFFDHPDGWNRIHRAMIRKAKHLHASRAAAAGNAASSGSE